MLFSFGVDRSHDNLQPHTAHATVQQIMDPYFECPPQPESIHMTSYGVIIMCLDHSNGGAWLKFIMDDKIKYARDSWLGRFFFSRNPHISEAVANCTERGEHVGK